MPRLSTETVSAPFTAMYKIRGADNNEYGPITADQVRQWIRENRLNRVSLAEDVASPGWRPLAEFPEFAAALAGGGSAPPAAAYVAAPVVEDPATLMERLKFPAILLIILGALGLLFTVMGPFLKATMMETMLQFFEKMNVPLNADQRSQMEAAKTAGLGLGDLFSLVLGLVVNSVILVGGLKMMKLQSWGLALASAILVMLPCGSCCCFIGLPIGIWAVVQLNKPEVKSAFR